MAQDLNEVTFEWLLHCYRLKLAGKAVRRSGRQITKEPRGGRGPGLFVCAATKLGPERIREGGGPLRTWRTIWAGREVFVNQS